MPAVGRRWGVGCSERAGALRMTLDGTGRHRPAPPASCAAKGAEDSDQPLRRCRKRCGLHRRASPTASALEHCAARCRISGSLCAVPARGARRRCGARCRAVRLVAAPMTAAHPTTGAARKVWYTWPHCAVIRTRGRARCRSRRAPLPGSRSPSCR